jgi:hypothetical protein
MPLLLKCLKVFHSIYPLELYLQLHPSPAKLEKEFYLYSPPYPSPLLGGGGVVRGKGLGGRGDWALDVSIYVNLLTGQKYGGGGGVGGGGCLFLIVYLQEFFLLSG